MAGPFDATVKELLEAAPAGWAAFLGAPRPADRVSVIDADVSTVTAAADKVIRVADAEPWLLHVEFQADWDGSLPARTLLYNAALHLRHGCPVASVVLLLRPRANATVLTGELEMAPPVGPGWAFRYTVVRVWELSADQLLAGPLTVALLATLAAPEHSVPAVVTDLARRIRTEATPGQGDQLFEAIANLLLMRFGKMAVDEIMREAEEVKEFWKSVYDTGKRLQLHHTLLRQGRKKFGEPTPETAAAVEAITDLTRLDALTDRLLDVNTWDELLADG